MSRKKRIEDPIKGLVVDDEEKWRKAMVSAMENLGCKVRKAEDAQTAIDLLDSHPDINVLVLDWDLRQGDSSETALGEDVLEKVILHRPDLIVVIVTGAHHNPDFVEWLAKERQVSQADLFDHMTGWEPFLFISKKKLVGEKDSESELKNGLPSLTRLLEQKGLIEEVDTIIRFRPVPPYRFHWPSGELPGKLGDKNGGQLTLPPRFERVICEMVDKDPLNPRAVKAELNYNEVAMKYVEGWGIEKRANMDESEVRAWIAQKGSQIEANPTRLAQLFARDFRRFLKSHGIMDSKAIIECDKKNQLYRMGKSWHRKPVLDHSEPEVVGSAPQIA